MPNDKDPVECVGSLLVHSKDVQELTTEHVIPKAHDEMVGSLLVHQADVQELSDGGSKKSTLVKRVTQRIANDVKNQPDDFNPWSNH